MLLFFFTFFCATDLLFNFTTLGSSGRTGPNSSVAYKGTSLETVHVVDGLQEWIVPITGRYQVEACGAVGGEGLSKGGGKGAKISGQIQLLKGTPLTVLVGQRGTSRSSYEPGSGGGGTFVVYTNSSTPLTIVGGGGGGGADAGEPGQEGTSGSVYGGNNGSGGVVCQDGPGIQPPDGGSGGGFLSDGCCFQSAKCNCNSCPKRGESFKNGGKGGQRLGCDYCNGGFGGGGAFSLTPGGGGGYSGGGATESKGGGGGSFKINGSWNVTAGVCEGDGYVVFRYMIP